VGRGGGGRLQFHMLDAALSIQTKFFFHIMDLPGGFLLKA
jgi:hypothetical protein